MYRVLTPLTSTHPNTAMVVQRAERLIYYLLSAIRGLRTAERTGSPLSHTPWSYVLVYIPFIIFILTAWCLFLSDIWGTETLKCVDLTALSMRQCGCRIILPGITFHSQMHK